MLKVDCDDSPTYPRGFVNEIEVTEMDTTVTSHIPGKLYYDNHWFCQCCFSMYFTHRTAGPYFMYLIPAQHNQLNTNSSTQTDFTLSDISVLGQSIKEEDADKIMLDLFIDDSSNEQYKGFPSKKIFADALNKAFHNRIYTGKYNMLNVSK